MPTNQELKEMEIEANATVGQKIRFREKGKITEQLEQEHWFEKRTGYSPQKAKKEYAEDLQNEKQEMCNQELQRLIEAKKFEERYTSESYRLANTTLFPVSIENEEKPSPHGI